MSYSPYDKPPKRPPDLFVPNDVTCYDKMVERAAAAPSDEYRYESNYKYYTGALKDGLWVPHVWWDDRHKKAMPVSENEVSQSEN